MSASRMIWFGRYEGWLRMVARGVRDGDKECIRYYSMLCPTDEDFKEYTRAYFEWCDHAMKNSTKPIDIRRKVMV